MEKVRLISKDKLKSTKDDQNTMYGTITSMHGFSSWPQRNYKCTFCTKEFKSAQALGGHMNVHRRDRAKLRLQSPSSNPNPNNFSSSSSSPALVRWPFLPYPTNYLSSPSPSPSRDEDFVGAQLGDIRKKLSMMGSAASGCVDVGFAQENGVWKKREIVRMGMGLLRDDGKDGLDLELRLGQSNYN